MSIWKFDMFAHGMWHIWFCQQFNADHTVYYIQMNNEKHVQHFVEQIFNVFISMNGA